LGEKSDRERETWTKSFVSLLEVVFSGVFSQSHRRKSRATPSIFEDGALKN